MSVKIQDWNRVASNVVLVAQGPDGKPALLAENKPASDYQGYTFTNGNCTQIIYKQGGANGTLVLTETFTYDNDGNPLTRTLTYP